MAWCWTALVGWKQLRPPATSRQHFVEKSATQKPPPGVSEWRLRPQDGQLRPLRLSRRPSRRFPYSGSCTALERYALPSASEGRTSGRQRLKESTSGPQSTGDLHRTASTRPSDRHFQGVGMIAPGAAVCTPQGRAVLAHPPRCTPISTGGERVVELRLHWRRPPSINGGGRSAESRPPHPHSGMGRDAATKAASDGRARMHQRAHYRFPPVISPGGSFTECILVICT